MLHTGRFEASLKGGCSFPFISLCSFLYVSYCHIAVMLWYRYCAYVKSVRIEFFDRYELNSAVFSETFNLVYETCPTCQSNYPGYNKRPIL